MPARPPCAVEVALTVLGGKWRTVVLAELKQGPMHHGELRRAVARISQKELTRCVRGLEADGLVVRTEIPGPVRRVQYALTDRGESLSTVLQSLWDFGETWATRHGITLAPTRPPGSDR